jgi:hypothetical protein
MAKSLTGVFTNFAQAITGGSDKTYNSQITDIKNKMKQSFYNESVIKSDIKNLLKTTIKNAFEQKSSAECKQLTRVDNVAQYLDVIKIDQEAVLDQNQSIFIEDFRKCIINMNLGAQVATDIGLKTENFQKNVQDILTTGAQASKQNAQLETSNEKGAPSADSDTPADSGTLANTPADTSSLFSNISTILMWTGIGIVVFFLIRLLSKFFSRSSVKRSSNEYYDEQEGGFDLLLDSLLSESSLSESSLFGGSRRYYHSNFGNSIFGNGIIWTLFVVLIVVGFLKSVSMISLVVLVIVGYMIYNSNRLY